MSDERTGREDCFICSRGNPDVLEAHHIVPRRYGGSDHDRNLVDVCPTCHQALETLYDERFYTAIGAEDRDVQLEFLAQNAAQKIDDVAEGIGLELTSLAASIRADHVGNEGDVDARVREVLDEERESQNRPELTSDDREDVKEIVAALNEPSINEAIDAVAEAGFTARDAAEAIETLRKRGEVYEVAGGLRVI